MPYALLQGGRRRRRRRRPVVLAVAVLALGTLALSRLGALAGHDAPARHASAAVAPVAPLPGVSPAALAGGGTAPSPLAVRLDPAAAADPVRDSFGAPPRAGLLFDLDTGRVLWRRHPTRVLPIASLTKMMTALVVADRLPPGSRVPITARALHYRGSGVGLLPRGRRVGVEALLHGLLLPSGNDAAIALAEGAEGSVERFVAAMNASARAMGLTCTRFVSPEGLSARNASCAADLAALGRALLRTPRLARIVRRRQAVLPFPIKGGRLYLYSTNPLLRMRYRGTLGIKTGYTEAAGRCLVAAVRRGRRRLGVVLLGSPDPGRQARHLLERGFRAVR